MDAQPNGLLPYKIRIIAIFSILLCGLVGVAPLPLWQGDSGLLNGQWYSLVKAFAAGIVLCLGFVHIFQNAVHDLEAVSDFPWAGKLKTWQ
jgi:hypothetical protein